MKWRCEWCGKPHEVNDPPCDNCGHHKFEKAVVPVAPEDPDHEREPVWVCTECGRQHQKNSPPCSRCGNADLERRIPDDDDFAEELAGTSYLELMEPQYVAGLAIVLVAGGVLVLAFLGVITLPGMDGDVPGNANSVHGLDLATVESAYVEELDSRREAAGLQPTDRVEGLDDAARLYNQRTVRVAHGDGELPGERRIREEMDGACADRPARVQPFDRAFDGGEDPAFASAEALAAALVDTHEETYGLSEADDPRIGVDVHAGPDERVFVSVLVCQ